MYRVHAQSTKLLLVNPGTSFFGRLRTNARVLWTPLFWSGLALAGASLFVTLAFSMGGFTFGMDTLASAGEAWFDSLLFFGGIWFLFALARALGVVAKSAFEGPLEQSLPAALTLYEDRIEVTPPNGEAYSTKWSFIAAYKMRWRSLVFVLGREPRLELEIGRSSVDAKTLATIVGWLGDHAVPRE
jgi:hypothetical protein